MTKNPIFSEIDFEKNGKQLGFLRLPHSVHHSAYGWIPIPIASIKNGDGPTVLIMGGNHGDEYEGQILAANLIRLLEPDMLNGQVILLPMANFPAAKAGKRTSPIDEGNLNRSFPGKPNGNPTEIIAHYIEHSLLPLCDYVIDLHSGGTSLIYNGANMLVLRPRNKQENQQIISLLNDFGLPNAFFIDANPVTISSAARRQGAISIVTELGGGGYVNNEILKQAKQGILHFLYKQKVLHAKFAPESPPAKPRIMRIDSKKHYVYARHTGVFVPHFDLGCTVKTGETAGHVHFPDQPWRTPEPILFVGDGEIICQRALAQVNPGDCVFQLGEELNNT